MLVPRKRRRISVLVVLILAGVGVVWYAAPGSSQPPRPIDPKRPPAQPEGKTPQLTPTNPNTKPADGEDLIKPGDRLYLRGVNVFERSPIDGAYRVEASGNIALGSAYGGRIKVQGLMLDEAEGAVQKQIRMFAPKAEVSVSRYDSPEDARLERRMQQLEQEVRELRAAVEALQRK